MTRAWSSWSAGKDSYLALLRARDAGLAVDHLVTMFEADDDLSRSHGVPAALVRAQAAALGCSVATPGASWATYEAVLGAEMARLRDLGYTDAVFGDIDLQAHRDWEERVCAAGGMRASFPLWMEDRRGLAAEILDRGIEAVVVCVDHRYLDPSFAGRVYDEAFLADLPAGVDWCGENGEFHTFVTNGPGFAAPVPVTVRGVRTVTAPPELGALTYTFARLTP